MAVEIFVPRKGRRLEECRVNVWREKLYSFGSRCKFNSAAWSLIWTVAKNTRSSKSSGAWVQKLRIRNDLRWIFVARYTLVQVLTQRVQFACVTAYAKCQSKELNNRDIGQTNGRHVDIKLDDN